MSTPAPIVVTAALGAADHARLDALRRDHFPPERNQLAAHLTLFHALPPSAAPEVERRLRQAVLAPAPRARLQRLLNLGRGVAFLVESSGLVAIRRDLAEAFAGLLTPQDAAGFRPHVTIQNKVTPTEARTLLARLTEEFEPSPLAITGLSSFWYRGGPWEPIATHRFRGGAS